MTSKTNISKKKKQFPKNNTDSDFRQKIKEEIISFNNKTIKSLERKLGILSVLPIFISSIINSL